MKRLFKISLMLFIIFIIFVVSSCDRNDKKEYIGIVSALDNEIEILVNETEVERIDEIGGIDYIIGKLANKNVVIAKAGIGKIRSSSGITAMINNYNISKVLFTGVAGGILDSEKILDVVVATKLVEHDYGRIENSGFIWTKGDPGISKSEGDYYECDSKLVNLAYEIAQEVVGENHTFKGVIATGDQFVANEEYVKKLEEDFDAYVCEMEGASIAVVCTNYDIPFVVIRTLSDKADGNAHESYEEFADEAANNSSLIVIKMLSSL